MGKTFDIKMRPDYDITTLEAKLGRFISDMVDKKIIPDIKAVELRFPDSSKRCDLCNAKNPALSTGFYKITQTFILALKPLSESLNPELTLDLELKNYPSILLKLEATPSIAWALT